MPDPSPASKTSDDTSAGIGGSVGRSSRRENWFTVMFPSIAVGDVDTVIADGDTSGIVAPDSAQSLFGAGDSDAAIGSLDSMAAMASELAPTHEWGQGPSGNKPAQS